MGPINSKLRQNLKFSFEQSSHEEKVNFFNEEAQKIIDYQKEWAAQKEKPGISLKDSVENHLIHPHKWLKADLERKNSSCKYFLNSILKKPHDHLAIAKKELELMINVAKVDEKESKKLEKKIEMWGNALKTDRDVKTMLEGFHSWNDKSLHPRMEKFWKKVCLEPDNIPFIREQIIGLGIIWQADYLKNFIQEKKEKFREKYSQIHYVRTDFLNTLIWLNLIGVIPIPRVAQTFKNLFKTNKAFADNCRKQIKNFNEKQVFELIEKQDWFNFKKFLAKYRITLYQSHGAAWSDPNPKPEKYLKSKYDWENFRIPLGFCYKKYFNEEMHMLLLFHIEEMVIEGKKVEVEIPEVAYEILRYLLKQVHKQEKLIPYMQYGFTYSLDTLTSHPDWIIYQKLSSMLEVLHQIGDAKALHGLRHLAYHEKGIESPFWNHIIKMLEQAYNNENSEVILKYEELHSYCGHRTMDLFVKENNKLEYLLEGEKAKKALSLKLQSLKNDLEGWISEKTLSLKNILYYLYVIQLAMENDIGLGQIEGFLNVIKTIPDCEKFLEDGEVLKLCNDITTHLAHIRNSNKNSFVGKKASSFDEFKLSILAGDLKNAQIGLKGYSDIYKEQKHILEELADVFVETKAVTALQVQNLLAFTIAYLESDHGFKETNEIAELKKKIDFVLNACENYKNKFHSDEESKIVHLKFHLQEKKNALKDQNQLELQSQEHKKKLKFYQLVEEIFSKFTSEHMLVDETQALSWLITIENAALYGYGTFFREVGNVLTEESLESHQNKLAILLERLKKNKIYEHPTVRQKHQEVSEFVNDRKLSRTHSMKNPYYLEFLESILQGGFSRAMMMIEGSQYFPSPVKDFLIKLVEIVKNNPENDLYLHNLLYLAVLYIENGDVPVDWIGRESMKLIFLEIVNLCNDKTDSETLRLRDLLQSYIDHHLEKTRSATKLEAYISEVAEFKKETNSPVVRSRRSSLTGSMRGGEVKVSLNPMTNKLDHFMVKDRNELIGEVNLYELFKLNDQNKSHLDNFSFKHKAFKAYENKIIQFYDKETAEILLKNQQERLINEEKALRDSVERSSLEIQKILKGSPSYEIETKIWEIQEHLLSFSDKFLEQIALLRDEQAKIKEELKQETKGTKEKDQQLKMLIKQEVSLRKAFDYVCSFLEFSSVQSDLDPEIEKLIPIELKKKLEEFKKINLLKYPLTQILDLISATDCVENLLTSYLTEEFGKIGASEYVDPSDSNTNAVISPNLVFANLKVKSLELFIGFLFLIKPKKKQLKTDLIAIADKACKNGNFNLANLIFGALDSFAENIQVTRTIPSKSLKELEELFGGHGLKKAQGVLRKYAEFERTNRPYFPVHSRLFNHLGLAIGNNKFISEDGKVVPFGMQKANEIRNAFKKSADYCRSYEFHYDQDIRIKFSNLISRFFYAIPKIDEAASFLCQMPKMIVNNKKALSELLSG